MLPWNNPLIFLSLLGGFVFLDWCIYTRLRHQRLDSNRLVIESAFAGIVLALITSIVFGSFRNPMGIADTVRAHRGSLIAFLTGFSCVVGGGYFRGFSRKNAAIERLLKSTIAGLSIPVPAVFVILLCFHPQFLAKVQTIWQKVVGLDYAATALVSFLLGVVGSLLINFLADRDAVAIQMARQEGDHILSLCYQAAQLNKPITVILSNKRAYSGYVFTSPNLKADSHLSLIVAIQGCLGKDSSEIRWEANYLADWNGDSAKARKFVVSLPMRIVEHAHLAEDLNYNHPIVTATDHSPIRLQVAVRE